jgi:hypothetical protein
MRRDNVEFLMFCFNTFESLGGRWLELFKEACPA